MTNVHNFDIDVLYLIILPGKYCLFRYIAIFVLESQLALIISSLWRTF